MITPTKEICAWTHAGVPCQIFPESPVEGLIRIGMRHPWAGCRPEQIQLNFGGEIVRVWPALDGWAISVVFPGLSPDAAAGELELLADAAAVFASDECAMSGVVPDDDGHDGDDPGAELPDGVYAILDHEGREHVVTRERGVWIDWMGLRFEEQTAEYQGPLALK